MAKQTKPLPSFGRQMAPKTMHEISTAVNNSLMLLALKGESSIDEKHGVEVKTFAFMNYRITRRGCYLTIIQKDNARSGKIVCSATLLGRNFYLQQYEGGVAPSWAHDIKEELERTRKERIAEIHRKK